MSKLNINLLPYQMRLQKATNKYLALIGGTGSGKTYFVPRWLYGKMNEYPNNEWIVSSPSIKMLKRNPVKYIKNFFDANNIKYEYNQSDMVMKLDIGVIYFISAETPDQMQGVHAKGIIGDEAGLFDMLWYQTAIQRLGFTKGQMLLTTTPYYMNWLKTEILDNYLNGNTDFYVENPTSIDNPYYPKSEYYRAKERLPAWKFKMMYEGQFTKPAGLIYDDYEIIDDIEIPANWEKFRGLDFGHNHPSAMIWIAKHPSKEEYYIYKEWKQSGLNYYQIRDAVKQENILTYADWAQRIDLETLVTDGCNVVFADKSVIAGILYVYSLFQTRKMKVFKSCKFTVDELNTYEWDMDKTENLLEKPKKINDDLVDCIRYSAYSHQSNNQSAGLMSAGSYDSILLNWRVYD